MSGCAFSGRAGSGKSTMARALRDTLTASGQPAKVFSFAAEIKKEVYDLYGICKTDIGGREALIEHGEKRRLADSLYWCRKLEPRLQSAQADGVLPIVDDLRFRVEGSFLAARGFWLVRVVAPKRLREERLAAQGMDAGFASTTHVSETELDQWHRFDRYVFRVGGDVAPFVQRVVDDLFPAKKGQAA